MVSIYSATSLLTMFVMQLFSIEGRSEQDYLHQMERDACISYVADAVCPCAVCILTAISQTLPDHANNICL